jgi:L-lactate dehydrogenase complex protein LldG
MAPAATRAREGGMSDPANQARREKVFGAVRQSLGHPARSADRVRELDERIAKHKANLIPMLAKGSRRELLERFIAMAEAAACTIIRVADESEIPGAVSDYLRDNNLAREITVAPDARVSDLDWASQPMLTVQQGVPGATDLVGVAPALGGIAETGTLAMTSGSELPSTLNFLPDYHIVTLRASDVVGSYEEVFERLRKAGKVGRSRKFTLPRTLNLITGPSRTGDIELTIHLGAHGPRSLHLVIVDDDEAAGKD